jgi:hypothetical protein
MPLFSLFRRKPRGRRLGDAAPVRERSNPAGHRNPAAHPIDAARELAAALAVKGIRVDTLMRDFPHVMNRLAMVWEDHVRLKAVMDDLLIDHRGGRRGFPPEALAELLAVHELCEPFFPKPKPSPWDQIKKR